MEYNKKDKLFGSTSTLNSETVESLLLSNEESGAEGMAEGETGEEVLVSKSPLPTNTVNSEASSLTTDVANQERDEAAQLRDEQNLWKKVWPTFPRRIRKKVTAANAVEPMSKEQSIILARKLLEEEITAPVPTGVNKRKTDQTSEGKSRTEKKKRFEDAPSFSSYKSALESHKVGLRSVENRDFSEKEMSELIDYLTLGALFDIADKELLPGYISIQKRPGHIFIIAKDENTVTWLRKYADRIGKKINLPFKVLNEDELPKAVIALARFRGGAKIPNEQLLAVIGWMNPLDTSNWQVVKNTNAKDDPDHSIVIFSMDEKSAKAIKEMPGQRISFRAYQTALRFCNSEEDAVRKTDEEDTENTGKNDVNEVEMEVDPVNTPPPNNKDENKPEGRTGTVPKSKPQKTAPSTSGSKHTPTTEAKPQVKHKTPVSSSSQPQKDQAATQNAGRKMVQQTLMENRIKHLGLDNRGVVTRSKTPEAETKKVTKP